MFEDVKQCVLIISSSPTSLSLTPTSLLTQLHILLPTPLSLNPICVASLLPSVGPALKHGQPTKVACLRKTDSSPSRYQIPTTPQVVMGLCAHLLLSTMRLELPGFYACCYGLCGFICSVARLYLEILVSLWSSTPSGSHCLSMPFAVKTLQL